MRISTAYIAFGAALVASPALAQLNVGLGGQGGVNIGGQGGVNLGGPVGGNVPVGGNIGVGGQVGGNVGVGIDPSRTIGTATGTLDRTVNRVDRSVNGALDSDLRIATAADLRAGAAVRDNRGRRVGVVQSVHGNMAVIVSGNERLHVPLAALYRSSTGLITRLSKAELRAAASANARAGANIRN